MKLGYRVTPARKELLDIFSKTKKPLSAQQLASLLFQKSLKVNKTTIYREISFLSEKGFIKELYISSGERFYESANLSHHHHLICTDCGTIEDVTLKNDLEKEEKRLEAENNFKIYDHSLEFFGLCASCG